MHDGSGPNAGLYGADPQYPGGRNIRIRKQKVARVPLQMTKTTIDRIIYPVQTKRGLKYPKKK